MIDDDRIDSDLPDYPGEDDHGPVPLKTVDAADLLVQKFEPPRFWAQHIGPEASLILVSGDTGSGKTALLMHLSVAAASGMLIAGTFPVAPDLVVLYVNGEMGAPTLVRYLHEAAAGLGVTVPRSRLYFEGSDGVALWRFADSHSALEQLVADLRPHVVVLDTQRALLIEDECDTAEVRRAFGWLRSHIVNRYGASVVIAHHLRKLGPVSNGARERVAGSRDIIASVDLHLSVQARSGAPMHALRLDKTRSPIDGVSAGAEWPVEARLEPGAPNRSIFAASAPQSAAIAADASAEERAVEEIRATLDATGPSTIDDVGAKSGTGRRAWKRLMAAGELVETGKRGRKTVYALKSSLPAEGELWDEIGE